MLASEDIEDIINHFCRGKYKLQVAERALEVGISLPSEFVSHLIKENEKTKKKTQKYHELDAKLNGSFALDPEYLSDSNMAGIAESAGLHNLATLYYGRCFTQELKYLRNKNFNRSIKEAQFYAKKIGKEDKLLRACTSLERDFQQRFRKNEQAKSQRHLQTVDENYVEITADQYVIRGDISVCVLHDKTKAKTYYTKAIEMYTLKHEYQRAGEISIILGNHEQATLFFSQSNKFSYAGILEELLGNEQKAKNWYLQAFPEAFKKLDLAKYINDATPLINKELEKIETETCAYTFYERIITAVEYAQAVGNQAQASQLLEEGIRTLEAKLDDHLKEYDSAIDHITILHDFLAHRNMPNISKKPARLDKVLYEDSQGNILMDATQLSNIWHNLGILLDPARKVRENKIPSHKSIGDYLFVMGVFADKMNEAQRSQSFISRAKEFYEQGKCYEGLAILAHYTKEFGLRDSLYQQIYEDNKQKYEERLYEFMDIYPHARLWGISDWVLKFGLQKGISGREITELALRVGTVEDIIKATGGDEENLIFATSKAIELGKIETAKEIYSQFVKEASAYIHEEANTDYARFVSAARIISASESHLGIAEHLQDYQYYTPLLFKILKNSNSLQSESFNYFKYSSGGTFLGNHFSSLADHLGDHDLATRLRKANELRKLPITSPIISNSYNKKDWDKKNDPNQNHPFFFELLHLREYVTLHEQYTKLG